MNRANRIVPGLPAVVCLLLLLPVAPAHAHRLHAEARVQNGCIRAEFFFSDGLPAHGLQVTLESDDRPPEILGETDAEGAVSFRPPGPGTFRLIARGAGHSNAGRPLILTADMVAEALGDAGAPASQPSTAPADAARPPEVSPAEPPAGRRRAVGFPWGEVLASFGFVLLLTLVTLVLMRSCDASRAPDRDETAALRAEVERLRRELEALRRHSGRGDGS